MSSLVISSIVLVCVFGSGMLGLFLRASLPDHHLSEDSTGIVKLGVGLLATMSALVLGLLIASAKVSFDRLNDEFTQTAATVIMIDRTLADYGPEAKASVGDPGPQPRPGANALDTVPTRAGRDPNAIPGGAGALA